MVVFLKDSDYHSSVEEAMPIAIEDTDSQLFAIKETLAVPGTIQMPAYGNGIEALTSHMQRCRREQLSANQKAHDFPGGPCPVRMDYVQLTHSRLHVPVALLQIFRGRRREKC
jgi:hypothetical protein